LAKPTYQVKKGARSRTYYLDPSLVPFPASLCGSQVRENGLWLVSELQALCFILAASFTGPGYSKASGHLLPYRLDLDGISHHERHITV